ncbi:MAG: NAD-dependent epimerase/dehydratase family protein [Candidatus Aminicenantes bacterium]
METQIGMTCFVTGATGYVGAALVKRLAGSGRTVHALYRSISKTEQLKHPRIRWHQGELLDSSSLEKAMSGCRYVFHTGAQTGIWCQNGDSFFQINVRGTKNILDCAYSLGVEKVVVTSTAGVFGPSDIPVDESSGFASRFFTEYEKTKAAADRLALQYAREKMNIVIVHPTRIYGPGPLGQSNSITRLVKLYMEGKWRFLPVNRLSRGNYVYIGDVVEGHILALEKGLPGESYILGGENISYQNFFRTLKTVSGKNHYLLRLPARGVLGFSCFLLFLADIFKIPPPVTPGMVRKLNADWMISSRKAEKKLGYCPASLAEGLQKTVFWLKSRQI